MRVEFPQVFHLEAREGEDEAAIELAQGLRDLEIEAPFVLSSIHGQKLAARIEGPGVAQRPLEGANQTWAADLAARARHSGADAIVAIGGGRCIDMAKLAAARAGLTVVAVPTQLSHDGICSPVAVVPDLSGSGQSVGAIAPRAVFVSVPTLQDAPTTSLRAGIGDLMANPLALRDWALAAERGLEETNQRAWDLSVESLELIKPHMSDDPSAIAKDPRFLTRLADALILSGLAMICAGTSRPASGAEHEVSHAIDASFGGRAMHGAQVAFGCVISMSLYGEDPVAFRAGLERLGLPQHPADLGLSEQDMVRLLLDAPDTRPGRFTILEHSDLDAAGARALVGRIWGRD
ncbi:iron-containing alcohol dehydrogenase family protein [soil metagenome]